MFKSVEVSLKVKVLHLINILSYSTLTCNRKHVYTF